MPTSGQFVAMWEYNGAIWSSTMRYDDDGELKEYSIDGDGWVAASRVSSSLNPVFFTIGDMG